MNDILHIGLDVGSTTVKIIVMDNDKNTIYSDYRRHFSDTKNTVCNVLTDLAEKYEDYDKIPKIIITEDIKTKQVNPKSKNLLKKEANEVLKENYENVEENLLFSKDNMNLI